jgi:hypothetical protein
VRDREIIEPLPPSTCNETASPIVDGFSLVQGDPNYRFQDQTLGETGAGPFLHDISANIRLLVSPRGSRQMKGTGRPLVGRSVAPRYLAARLARRKAAVGQTCRKAEPRRRSRDICI